MEKKIDQLMNIPTGSVVQVSKYVQNNTCQYLIIRSCLQFLRNLAINLYKSLVDCGLKSCAFLCRFKLGSSQSQSDVFTNLATRTLTLEQRIDTVHVYPINCATNQ